MTKSDVFRKIRIGSALVASLLGGCGSNNLQSENSVYQIQNKPVAEQPLESLTDTLYNEQLEKAYEESAAGDTADSYSETSFERDEALSEDKLIDLYGKEAAKYALQIVDNGRRIRESPGKQENLYGKLEQRLKKRFPLITPIKLFGFIDEPKEAEDLARIYNAREKVLARAKKDGINFPVSFIVASLCNEGYSLDGSSSLNGFDNFGLDTFGSEFDNIATRGYLPEDFKNKFQVSENINELGQRVKSAEFKSKSDAFEAFTATLAHRQYLFFEDLRKNKINPKKIPQEQKLFFTYKYFNGGPNSAEKLLRKKSGKEVDRFFKRVMTYGSTGNSYVVLSGSQWLEASGATDPNPEGKYWWSK